MVIQYYGLTWIHLLRAAVVESSKEIMLISRLTKKYQATLPSAVRSKLGLKAGDSIVFEIQNDQVVVNKAQKLDLEFPQALNETLGEWNSEFDEEAFRDL